MIGVVRDAAVDLANKRDEYALARRITSFLIGCCNADRTGDIPDERRNQLNNDLQTLDRLIRQEEQAKAEQARQERAAQERRQREERERQEREAQERREREERARRERETRQQTSSGFSFNRSYGYNSPATTSSTKKDDENGCGGCLAMLAILIIGTSIGGPFGFFLALIIIGKLFDDK